MAAQLLPLSRYVYGTTRLGDETIPFDDRVAIARAAIDAGLSLHTSDQYGSALNVLNAAFDIDRSNIPNMIFKIGWNSVDQIRGQIEKQLAEVGLSSMTIGQLCLGGDLADDFGSTGNCIDALNELKAEGLVDHFVIEVFPWISSNPLKALEGGHLHKLVDALILYFNPLQCFATNDLWARIVEQNTPIVAMRTVAGGSVHRMADPASGASEYLQKRAVEVAPIFDRSGCSSWTEFCIRFAFSFPFVQATVGATARAENLREFVEASKSRNPLPREIVSEISALQRRWSDEVDRQAEPWTM